MPFDTNMLNNLNTVNILTTIVRANQNAVMTRIYAVNSKEAIYSVFDLTLQQNTYIGTLNACKKAWNRHYKNSRQFVTRSGSNHRYLSN